MNDVFEMKLSKPVNVTNTSFIRASVRERKRSQGPETPSVELVQFHVFIHCTRGHGRHMVDFVDHDMKRGTAIWVRPGQVQQWSEVHDDFDADVVVFASTSIPDLPLFEHLGATSIAHLGDDAQRLQEQMNWMAADLEKSQDQALAASVVGVLLRLFARHVQASDERSEASGRRLTTDFVASIDRNIHERTVSWHAKQIGASTRSVARATVSTLDQRPKEVIDARVVLAARRRLAWSNDDIATIARSLRFSEASNFSKFFRSRTGVSPSAFRGAVSQLNLS